MSACCKDYGLPACKCNVPVDLVSGASLDVLRWSVMNDPGMWPSEYKPARSLLERATRYRRRR